MSQLNFSVPSCDEIDCARNATREMIIDGIPGYVFACLEHAEMHHRHNPVTYDGIFSFETYNKCRA